MLYEVITQAVGLDISEQRIEYARTHYGEESIEYVVADIRKPLEDLGQFDFIWVRFVLEYYLDGSFEIVKNITNNLKPGGIMCLIDLDCNCLVITSYSIHYTKLYESCLQNPPYRLCSANQ